ncbi:MAG: hypothetical protein ACRDNI_11730 [Gaiellaceae bacterium]
MTALIAQHMLARPLEPQERPRAAHEITLRSRELARREGHHRPTAAIPQEPAPRRPLRAATAWARTLLA